MSGAEQVSRAPTRESVTIEQIVLADEPGRWRSLGFDVEGDRVQLGSVFLCLVGDEARTGTAPEMLEWSLREIDSTELDGLPTTRSSELAPTPALPHPNEVIAKDHVVAMTPALDRSVGVLQRAGLDLRRMREQPTPAGAPRQAFFRLGAEVLELVQEPDEALRRSEADAARPAVAERPARFWGLALLSSDLDRTVAAFGEVAGEPRDAVQAGRRIVTVKRSAGLAVPIAVISARAADDR